jgi:1-acyl-sn-glycerol-3-phosphate acyltransferase
MRRLIATAHSLTAWSLSIVLALAMTSLGVLFLPLASDRRRYAHRWARLYSRVVVDWFCLLDVRQSGREHIDEAFSVGRVVIVCNHQSLLDIPILLAQLPDYFVFVAKAELFRVPLLGFVMRLCGFVPLDRQDRREVQSALSLAGTSLDREAPVLLFPEGTRTRDGKLGRFKRGAVLTAAQRRVPILPVAIDGTFATLPPGRIVGFRGPVSVTAGSLVELGPIDPKDHAATTRATEELARTVERLLGSRRTKSDR